MALPPRPRAATFGNTANANRTRDLPPGSVVLGRYTVQKVLGRGGMATVYLAKHQQTDRLVALKLLDPEFSRDPAYVERFRREAKAAGRIRSDHVVAIYDLDAEVGGSLVLVMEFLEGQSMQSALKAGRFPIQKAISFGRQMLEGLAAAHEAGVIHRDLKPANLFIERSTTGSEKVKLLDFGISKLADASQQELTRDGQTLGTVAYMAPEQIRGKASATDPRVDLYSAGVSLFIMLTGKRPIDAEDTVQLLAAVLEHPPMTLAQATGLPFPAQLEAFIARALEKDPNRRFQTAIEMRDALVEAGKTIGYESTGPLSVPTTQGEPSGVVPRAVARTQMGVGGAPPPPTAAKQTMMGVGQAPPPPVMNAASPPAMMTSFPNHNVGAPVTMPAPMPAGLPAAPPLAETADPFGPMPGGLAPPPMATLAPPTFAVEPAAVAPASDPPKKSRAGLVILLSAVGLVALGGAGALVARSVNQRAAQSRIIDATPSNPTGAAQAAGATAASAPGITTPAAQLSANSAANEAAPVPAPGAGALPNVGAAGATTLENTPPPTQQPVQPTQPTLAAQPSQPAPQPAPQPEPQRAARATQSAATETSRGAPSNEGARAARATTSASTTTSSASTARNTATAPTRSANPFDPPPARTTTPAPQPAPTARTTNVAAPRTQRTQRGATATVVPF